MPRPRKTSYAGEKPPYSYVALCAMAIHSSSSKMMTLSQIYRFITDNFPFYRENSKRWQNSLRHNLSFNDCFVKVSKNSAHGGKGNYWTLHDSCAEMFHDGSFLRRKRRFHSDDEEIHQYKRTNSGDMISEFDPLNRNDATKRNNRCTPFTIDNILKEENIAKSKKTAKYETNEQKIDHPFVETTHYYVGNAPLLNTRPVPKLSSNLTESYCYSPNYIPYRKETACSCCDIYEPISRYQSCNRHLRPVKMVSR